VLPVELAHYIHEHIPLSRAMGMTVVSVEENAVVLRAPLAPNLNHQQSVFGGSAAALAILASWALLHVRLRAAGITERVVIQRNTMEYRQPILGEFTARATLEHPERWRNFTTALARKGKARVTVSAALEYLDRVAGTFTGEFVALGTARKASAAAAPDGR